MYDRGPLNADAVKLGVSPHMLTSLFVTLKVQKVRSEIATIG